MIFRAFDIIDLNKNITIEKLAEVVPEFKHLTYSKDLLNRLHIETIYDYFTKEQMEEIALLKQDESYKIPKDLDYNSSKLQLKFEEREKLSAVQPQTVNSTIILYSLLFEHTSHRYLKHFTRYSR